MRRGECGSRLHARASSCACRQCALQVRIGKRDVRLSAVGMAGRPDAPAPKATKSRRLGGNVKFLSPVPHSATRARHKHQRTHARTHRSPVLLCRRPSITLTGQQRRRPPLRIRIRFGICRCDLCPKSCQLSFSRAHRPCPHRRAASSSPPSCASSTRWSQIGRASCRERV